MFYISRHLFMNTGLCIYLNMFHGVVADLSAKCMCDLSVLLLL